MLAVALGVGLAAAAGSTSPARADDRGVVLSDTSFQPATIEIDVGDTVTWEHRDPERLHTVTATSGPDSWDSHPACTPPGTSLTCMSEGERYERSFPDPGTYEYHSKVHPEMTGTVVVRDPEDTTTSTTTTTAATTTTTTAATTTTTTAAPEATPDTAAPEATPETAPPSDPPAVDQQTGEQAGGVSGTGDEGSGAMALVVLLVFVVATIGTLLWRRRPIPALVVEDPDRPRRPRRRGRSGP